MLRDNIQRHTWSSHAHELELQDEIAEFLAGRGYQSHREHRFTSRDRVDFFAGAQPGAAPSVALEVKVEGSNVEIARQLQRYAARDEVATVLLVTTRNRHRDMPATLCGKPVHVVNVGRFM